ncbi:MAG: alpha-L-fucosidase [Propionibacteriaceae bacterium]|nr:alpha-L-fucosidase [Propionibacteriaceae bacterium]
MMQQVPATERLRWFTQARYGMFVHWGAYSMLGGYFHGRSGGKNAEWVMENLQVGKQDYANEIAAFNPHHWNAEEIAKLAKAAGMKYVVVTARHHDGLSMFDTKTPGFCDFQLHGSTAYTGPDPIQALSAACRAHGLKFGTYYSVMDCHDASQSEWGAVMQPGCFTDYKERMKRQLFELVYGYDPDLLWFDGEWHPWWTAEDGQEMYEYVLSLKPSIIVNNRVGKRLGVSVGDYATPEQEVPLYGLPYPWETCETINDSWGFHSGDTNWKNPKCIVDELVTAISGGGNYLLNIGPDGEGRVPLASQDVLVKVGSWLARHQEAVYGTDRSPIANPPSGVRFTAKEGKVFAFLLDYPAGELICELPAPARYVGLLASGSPLPWKSAGNQVMVDLRGLARDKYATVLEFAL